MDCFNHSCPFRVNETSHANRCECVACQNRSNSDFILASNLTLTGDELAMLTALRSGDKNYCVGNWCYEVLTITEYIEREAAIEAAKHAWAKGLEPSQYIEIIPAADVEPVRHGRWEWFEEWNPGTPDHPTECEDCGWRCSECKTSLDDVVGGYWDDPDDEPKLNYCPNCGARMDGDWNT